MDPQLVILLLQFATQAAKLIPALREDLKRQGFTDEEIDEAIARFDPSRYLDPLKP